MFRSFNAQLQDVLPERRKILDKFGGVDPGLRAALDRGMVEQHDRLAALRTVVAAIRQGQTRQWNRNGGDGRQMRTLICAFTGDPMAADPELIPRRLGWKVTDRGGRERLPKPPPWPTELWTAEATDWIALHPESKPWVPDRDELAAGEDRITRALQKAHDERNGPQGGSNTGRIR